MTFQPLQLISEYSTEIVSVTEKGNENPAWVKKEDGDEKFVITLNEWAIEKMFKESWVSKYILLHEYRLGFLMHEISHIRYNTFTGTKPFDDSLFQVIDNIVDDSRIENALWYDYPFYARPLRWTLSSVQPILTDLKSSEQETEDKIQALLTTLFHVSRFGVLSEEDDPDFVSFFLPLTLSATVNDRQNLLDACGLIYLYIIEQCGDDEQLKKSLKAGKVGSKAIGSEEIEEASSGEQVADSGVGDLVKQATEKDDPTKTKNKQAGHTEHDILVDDKTNAFCRQVINRRASEIAEMHTTFRLTREGWGEVSSYDDTQAIDRLVDAYVNSFTFDDGLNFTEDRRVVPAMTLWVVRDVSDSTSDMEDEYAEICVMLHAALADIPKVRSGQVDFSDSAKVIKDVSEGLPESRLYPYTDGGTFLTSAVEKLQEADFGDEQKVLCILTDGCFYDEHSVKPLVDRLVQEKGIDEVFIVYVDTSRRDLTGEQTIIDYPAYYCGPGDIPEVVYKTVVRLRDRY